MDFPTALRGLFLLDGVLVIAFILSVLAMFVSYRLTKQMFCQVCVAVSSVWVLNLVFRFMPDWVTVLLVGQSVAGASALVRDSVADRFGFNDLPKDRKRVAKQLTYFAAIVTGSVLGCALLVYTLGLPT